MDSNIDFSVLIPVYHKDEHTFFDKALNSVYCEQTVKPSEIVIVVDGPVGSKINNVIEKWTNKYPKIINVLYLPSNIGLGSALALGLKKCRHNIVARMDSDDISRFDRFEKQLACFELNTSISICGSNIAEFIVSHKKLCGERIVPEKLSQIKKFAKYRNPVNHPTVMFKRSDIINAGGYLSMPSFEDYYLWVRCIMKDLKIYNIQENLVFMRGGQPQLERRSGKGYVRNEWVFLRSLLKLGFYNLPSFYLILISRTFARIAPVSLLRAIYKLLRTQSER